MTTGFDALHIDDLSNHIVNTHHAYVRTAIPAIKNQIQEAVKEATGNRPGLSDIATTFDTLSDDLFKHIDGEEKYLFPYIFKLLNAKKTGEKLPRPGFGTIRKPLAHHYEEHDHATELMQKIHGLANGYQVAGDASVSLKSLYTALGTFEKDLEQHIHLENDVLFAQAIELEKEVVE